MQRIHRSTRSSCHLLWRRILSNQVVSSFLVHVMRKTEYISVIEIGRRIAPKSQTIHKGWLKCSNFPESGNGMLRTGQNSGHHPNNRYTCYPAAEYVYIQLGSRKRSHMGSAQAEQHFRFTTAEWLVVYCRGQWFSVLRSIAFCLIRYRHASSYVLLVRRVPWIPNRRKTAKSCVEQRLKSWWSTQRQYKGEERTLAFTLAGLRTPHGRVSSKVSYLFVCSYR